jgi:ribosomal protein S18 acetylase RimI-like enzyme
VRSVESFQVRVATAADAEAVARLSVHLQALHREACPALFNAPDIQAAAKFFLQQMAEPEVLVLLAHRNEKPLGYLFGKEVHSPANPFTAAVSLFYVHHMAVAPDARRSGVGRMLMSNTEAEAGTRGLASVRLNTWAFNTTAHRFFERVGYAPLSINMERVLEPVRRGTTREHRRL